MRSRLQTSLAAFGYLGCMKVRNVKSTRCWPISLVPMLALAAAAQVPSSGWNSVQAISPGTEVRVTSGGAMDVRGKLASTTDNSLTISLGRSQRSFSRAQIVSVAVKKTGHRLRNTLIGLGVGAAVGLVIGLATANQCEGEITCGLVGATGPIGGTVVGLVWPTGGWREIYRR
jgi:hypothetical protein